jgi:hypothetical protein
VECTDQAGFVRMMMKGSSPTFSSSALSSIAARPSNLAHAAVAKAAANGNALRPAPSLAFQEPAYDVRKLLREVLDRAMHDDCRIDIPFG